MSEAKFAIINRDGQNTSVRGEVEQREEIRGEIKASFLFKNGYQATLRSPEEQLTWKRKHGWTGRA